MPLKKPSEFYDKNPNSSFDDVKEELKNAKPEKVERISEAFEGFSQDLDHGIKAFLKALRQTPLQRRPWHLTSQ